MFDRIDRRLLAVSAQSLEAENTVAGREKGIVAALADIRAGMNLGSSLTDKHIARENELTVRSLYARRLDSESLPFLVEPIPFL